MITENRDDHEKLDVRGNEIEDVNLNKKQVFVFFGARGCINMFIVSQFPLGS